MTGTRKVAEGEVTCDLFAFFTTQLSREVATVHPKAMPVILTDAEDVDTWLERPWPDARRLQRPLADGALRTVVRGKNEDPPGSALRLA